MKTKVVYVLVCSRDDTYLEQFLLSLISLREHQPECRVEVVSDSESYRYILSRQDPLLTDVTLRQVDIPEAERGGTYRSRWLKTRLRTLTDGDFLYLDTDTLIARPLEGIDRFDADIAAVINRNGQPRLLEKEDKSFLARAGYTGYDDAPYYNAGVLLVRDTQPALAFFDNWHRLWLALVREGKPLYDQAPFFMANAGAGSLVRELPGEWNVQVRSDSSVHYFKDAIVVHTYAGCGHFEQNFIIPHIKETADGRPDADARELARNPLQAGLGVYRPRSFKGALLGPYSELLFRLRKHPKTYLGVRDFADSAARPVSFLLQRLKKG